jgi:ubiquinone/menaquinone biosynthesis C-methylase UbiE
MERFYQTEWQGIQFSDITTVSSTKLADSDFYNTFYAALFKKYSNYDELDSSWRQNKKEIAEWISNQVTPGCKVLSVGCGLGYMEAEIFKQFGAKIQLHVSDFATVALSWVTKILPAAQCHLNGLDEELSNERFDLIYFSAVDYALSTEDMIQLLKEYKSILLTTGRCLMISASYVEENLNFVDLVKQSCKNVLKKGAGFLGLYKVAAGQFWGWKRNNAEYCSLMKVAGFQNIENGFIQTQNQKYYYILANN